MQLREYMGPHACTPIRRLWDFVPAKFRGPPDIYIIHAWSGTFQEMVAALVHDLSPPPTKAAVAAEPQKATPVTTPRGGRENKEEPLSENDALDSIYVWIGVYRLLVL